MRVWARHRCRRPTINLDTLADNALIMKYLDQVCHFMRPRRYSLGETPDQRRKARVKFAWLR
jgi:hypothetical protein